jgi:flagellin-like protein
MKILKNAKALSPVVASIILIAVTVAVSIAVGVWMFGLTGTFMGGAEQLKITGVVFISSTPGAQDQFNITMTNPGTSPITVNEIWVGNTQYWPAGTQTPVTIASNGNTTQTVSFNWNQGYSYEIKAVTSKGNIATYPVLAPSA